MDTPRKPGRPRKIRKEINPTRQVGRWTEGDWDLIRQAAEVTDGGNVAAFAKRTLLRAARRIAKGKN